MKKLWYKYVTLPRLKKQVLHGAYAIGMINQMMIQNRVPRKARRQFFRELWRRPVSAIEIAERAIYGRGGSLMKGKAA